MVNIPMEAYIQKDLRAGSCVVAPIPKAIKSVMEVMVMATPACDIVAPILSVIDLDFSCSESVRTFQRFAFLTSGKRTLDSSN